MDRTRTSKGPHFCEGSRRLWLYLLKHPQSMREFARFTGVASSQLHRLMYGDRRPSLGEMELLQTTLRTPVKVWSESPREAFDLPAKKAA